jgi:hypothetical protein
MKRSTGRTLHLSRRRWWHGSSRRGSRRRRGERQPEPTTRVAEWGRTAQAAVPNLEQVRLTVAARARAVVLEARRASPSAEVLRALRAARQAVKPEHLRARVAERLGRSEHEVLYSLERHARDLGVREQDGVRRVERGVAIAVDERRDDAGRACGVRARVRRVLRGGLAARECVCA